MKKKLTRRFARLVAFVVVMAMAIGLLPAAAFAATGSEPAGEDTSYRMWYTSPATENYSGWQSQSLPIGNGKVGASVFGAIKQERLQLNEETFWSGGPDRVDPATGKAMRGSSEYLGGNIPSNGQDGQVLRQVQQYYLNGNNSAASNLAGSKLVGVSDDGGTQGYGYFLSFGSLFFDYQSPAPQSNVGVTNYVRDLDIGTSVASVSYQHDGTTYTREYFISHEDDVLVTRLTAEGKNKLNMNVKFDTNNVKNSGGEPNGNNGYQRTANKAVTVADDKKTGSIEMTGKVQDNNLQYDSQSRVILSGEGVLEADSANGLIKVKDATSVVTMTAIKTDYKEVYPGYRTGESADELKTRVQKVVTDAAGRADAAGLYETLKARHTGDYQSLFNRLKLDLGQQTGSASTADMLNGYKNGSLSAENKKYMEVLLYQYGRYLTIAGSRADSQLPTNLQGIWTWGNSSPWHSDFHANVNLQMNYWPTYASNLTESARPLVSYVDALQEPGQVTSKIYTGIEDGMMFHTQINPYGWTCPGWSFSWGWSTAAMPWIIQNCWEYYEYTQDEEYLRSEIYPMMQKACTFYENYLVDDGTGKLVSTPAYSPEHGSITNGNTYEQSLIWQLFDDAITAGRVLGEDEGNIIKWESIRDNLKGPVEVGQSGQIKEWFEETTIDSNGFAINANGNRMGEGGGHRHISHMLAAFPGDYISENNPELLDAAKVSMKMRTTTETTGWAMAQRVNTWARLGDANEAYTWITRILKGSGQGGTFQNMWGYHGGPFFQIDGNYGYTAGVNEMLMQSNLGYIHLLPALPAEWGNGSITGMLARGNFELDMAWANQHPTRVTVTSNAGGDAVLNYKNIAFAAVTDSDGNPVKYTAEGMDKIKIETEQGRTYVITNIPEGDVSVAPATPDGLKAERVSDAAVMVTWNKVATVASAEHDVVVALSEEEDSGINYNLYRKFEGGGTQLIAAGLKEDALIVNEDGTLSYQDAGEVAPYMGTISYQVAAVKDGVESRLSDAVKVEDTREQPTVESVTVTTESGVMNVVKADSQLQMVAAIAPATVANNEVTWSIANDGTNASISAAGVVNTGTKTGTITVKAISKADGKTAGQATINVTIPSKYLETYVDDGKGGNGDIGTINPVFTFEPANTAWEVWAGEPTKHYGGTKAESSNINSKLSYEFEGVGIAVYGQKHLNFGAMKIAIDGEEKGIFSMNDGSGSGTSQQMVAKFEDLAPGAHKITISPAVLEGTTKKQANLDYFVVYQPNPDVSADKTELQATIEAQQANWAKGGDVFETATWEPFAEAFAAAVGVMNAADATDEGVQNAVQALAEAGAALVGKTPAPIDMAGAEFKAQGIEAESLVLKWNKIDKAQEYNIYRGENKIGSTKNDYIRVINLQEGADYTFRLEAVAKSGAKGVADLSVKTLGSTDNRPKSAEIVKILRIDGGYAVAWKGDGSENQTFSIRVNGQLVTEKPTTDTGYMLTNMPQDALYTIAITALSNGNSAAPTAVTLRYGEVKVTEVPILNSLSVPRGTSFEALKEKLPQKAEVVLSDGSHAELAIEWQQGSYDGNKGNTYTLDGTLTMGALMSNPDNSTVKIDVTIEAGGSIADKTGLEKLVADIMALKSSDFRSSAWKVMQEQKLPAAQAVIMNLDATQDQVDNARVQLMVAKNALLKERINKQSLQTYILMAEERVIMTSDFTASTINATKKALEKAKVIDADADTTQAAIDTVSKELFGAVMNMLWQADKSSLSLLVEAARELEENLYTPDKWAVFADALREAEAILADADLAEADQAKVEATRKKLFDAMNGLVDRADMTALNQAIVMAEDILNNSGKYAPASLQGLQDELNRAKGVAGNANADRKTVDDATKALNDLLVKVYPKSNKDALVKSIRAARSVDLSMYTAPSAQAVSSALSGAEKLNQDENVKQDVVDKAQQELDKAVKALVPDPSKPQQPETTAPVTPENPSAPGTPGTTTPVDPGTGTEGTTFQPAPEPDNAGTDVADAGDQAGTTDVADAGDQAAAAGGAYYDPETEVATDSPTVMIGDTPVPLVGGGATQTWSLVNMILMIWAAAFGGLAVAGYWRRKKASAFRIAGIVMGIGAIAAFFFTQAISGGKMAIVDEWTVLMGVIVAAQLVTAFLDTKRHNLLKRNKA